MTVPKLTWVILLCMTEMQSALTISSLTSDCLALLSDEDYVYDTNQIVSCSTRMS